MGPPLAGPPPRWAYSMDISRCGGGGLSLYDSTVFPDCVDLFVLAERTDADLDELHRVVLRPRIHVRDSETGCEWTVGEGEDNPGAELLRGGE